MKTPFIFALIKKLTSEYSYFIFFISGVLLTLLILILVIIFNPNHFPAPRFSESESLNEKAQWLKLNAKSCDVLIAGSSMGLNNISGTLIKNSLHNITVVNTGSWGMSIEETYKVLEILTPICKPKIIILASNFFDYEKTWNKTIDWYRLMSYLNNEEPTIYSYMMEMDLNYYLGTFISRLYKRKKENRVYDSLEFDETGGVLLETISFEIIDSRWNGYLTVNRLDSTNIMQQMSSLTKVEYLAQRFGIKLLVVTTPLRGVAKNALEDSINVISKTVPKFLMSNQTIFFDGAKNTNLKDSYFTDFAHLNREGANEFTQSLLLLIHNALNL